MHKYQDLERKLREIRLKPTVHSETRRAEMRQRMAKSIAESERTKQRQTSANSRPSFTLPAFATALASLLIIIGAGIFAVSVPETMVRQVTSTPDVERPNILFNPTFDDGKNSWKVIAPTISTGLKLPAKVIEGELCVNVPDGIDNAWDAQLKQDNITYKEGYRYTIEFDGYVVGNTPVQIVASTQFAPEDTSSTAPHSPLSKALFTLRQQPERYKFVFTSLVDTADDVDKGDFTLQLGDQGAFEACFDNLSITESPPDTNLTANHEVIPPFYGVQAGDFSTRFAEVMWQTKYGRVTENGEMCLDVPDGVRYRWDADLTQHQLPFVKDHQYKLTFDAYAKHDDVSVRVIAGLGDAPYPFFLEDHEKLTTEKTSYEFVFVADFDTYKNLNKGDISLQVGGQGAVNVCFDNVVLTEHGE